MAFQYITLETDGAVATLTLNRPDMLNAIAPPMITEMSEAVDQVAATGSGIRCLIMTGAGRGFCAGADLTSTDGAAETPGGRDLGKVLDEYYHPLLLKMRDLPMPFITAVNGAAAGIGMSFALMGDLALAARSAYFLQAFRRIGLVPDGGSTWILPRLVGTKRAMELSMLGEKLPAERALEWGLINQVHDDDALMGAARKLAADLSEGPTMALSLIRKAIWASPGNTFEAQLHVERMFQQEAGLTADFEEGVRAFLEKRPAKFQGK